jgi:hypothetical protein
MYVESLMMTPSGVRRPQPVFLFPEGDGENLYAIDSEDHGFVALSAPLDAFHDFIQQERLGSLRFNGDAGRIKTHTQFVHLVTPTGDKLASVNLRKEGEYMAEKFGQFVADPDLQEQYNLGLG